MHEIHHPHIPFVQPIYESLCDGAKIDIHGHVRHHGCDNFAVELLSGPHIVLHANFRFSHHEHCLVLNAASYGQWGPEIRVHNPLQHEHEFHLHIKVHHNHYDIEVNGHNVAEFPHRFPFNTVQALGIKGGVEIHKIKFEHFPFHNSWGSGHFDYGHGGYHGYGTPSYCAPEFSHGHHNHSVWEGFRHGGHHGGVFGGHHDAHHGGHHDAHHGGHHGGHHGFGHH